MIYVFHGENHDASRRELTKVRLEKNAENITLDGKVVTLNQLVQSTESTSLFGGDRLVIIENLVKHRLGKKSPDAKEFIAWIEKIPTTVDVVFWEEKELTKTALAVFPPKSDIAVFKLSRSLFSFVESLRPGNQKEALILLHEALLLDAPELIFAMISRQFRLLLTVSSGSALDLAPWQARKISSQAQHFSTPRLFALYQNLLDIDGTIKSGLSAFSLREHLELFATQL